MVFERENDADDFGRMPKTATQQTSYLPKTLQQFEFYSRSQKLFKCRREKDLCQLVNTRLGLETMEMSWEACVQPWTNPG